MQNILAHSSLGNNLVADLGTVTKKSGASDFDMYLGNSIGEKMKDTESRSKLNVTSEALSKNQEKHSVKESRSKTFLEKDNKTQNKISVIEPEEEESDGTSLAEQVMAMLNQIRNAIMEALNMTSDELDQMMEELNLNITDFLDSQSIMQLVLNNSGATDSTALLLDEQLGDTFRNLVLAIDDIKKSMISELTKNEIDKILEQGLQQEELSIYDNLFDDTDSLPVKTDLAVSKELKALKSEEETSTFQSTISEGESIDREYVLTTGSNDDSSELNEDNKNLNTHDFDAFIDKLSASFEKTIVELNDETVEIHNIKEIAQQIVEQVHVMVKPGETTMELKLYPEHLGKVNLTITATESTMSARFVVQNEIAKEALESQLITLKDTLAQQGIKVESIEVTVASYSFEQNSKSDDGDDSRPKKSGTGRKITLDEAIAMSEEPVIEDAHIHIPGSGYNIDTTA